MKAQPPPAVAPPRSLAQQVAFWRMGERWEKAGAIAAPDRLPERREIAAYSWQARRNEGRSAHKAEGPPQRASLPKPWWDFHLRNCGLVAVYSRQEDAPREKGAPGPIRRGHRPRRLR